MFTAHYECVRPSVPPFPLFFLPSTLSLAFLYFYFISFTVPFPFLIFSCYVSDLLFCLLLWYASKYIFFFEYVCIFGRTEGFSLSAEMPLLDGGVHLVVIFFTLAFLLERVRLVCDHRRDIGGVKM